MIPTATTIITANRMAIRFFLFMFFLSEKNNAKVNEVHLADS